MEVQRAEHMQAEDAHLAAETKQGEACIAGAGKKEENIEHDEWSSILRSMHDEHEQSNTAYG